jgi:hypothetical protein
MSFQSRSPSSSSVCATSGRIVEPSSVEPAILGSSEGGGAVIGDGKRAAAGCTAAMEAGADLPRIALISASMDANAPPPNIPSSTP